jgi:hypothetical protein
MGPLGFAGIFLLVILLLLLGYSAWSDGGTDDIPDKLKGIIVLAGLLGIFLILMDNLWFIFPWPERVISLLC